MSFFLCKSAQRLQSKFSSPYSYPRNDVHDILVLLIERRGKRCMIKNKEHFIEGSGSLIARQGATRSRCIRRRMCSGLFKDR